MREAGMSLAEFVALAKTTGTSNHPRSRCCRVVFLNLNHSITRAVHALLRTVTFWYWIHRRRLSRRPLRQTQKCRRVLLCGIQGEEPTLLRLRGLRLHPSGEARCRRSLFPRLCVSSPQEAVHEALGCGVGCDDASTASEHRHNRRGGRGGTHLVRVSWGPFGIPPSPLPSCPPACVRLIPSLTDPSV